MKDAKDTMEIAERCHKANLARFEKQNKETTRSVETLTALELEIVKSFEDFSNVFEKIQNKPEFKEYVRGDVRIPSYSGEELKRVSIGATALLSGIGGATISSSASAAAVAGAGIAGGGGIALLSAATLGIGALVGGAIFNFAGSSLSNKADEAYSQMRQDEKEIDRICDYMGKLSTTANKYRDVLSKVNKVYMAHLTRLKQIVNLDGKTDYNYFSGDERLLVKNSSLLVGLLYKMCKVQIVQKAKDENEMNKINHIDITRSIAEADSFLSENKF